MQKSFLVHRRLGLLGVFALSAASSLAATFQPLDGFAPTAALRVSADGSTVAGPRSGIAQDASIWNQEHGFTALPGFPGEDYPTTFIWSLSADGRVAVGSSYAYDSSGKKRYLRAFRWSAEEGMVRLAELGDFEEMSEARLVSADGSMVYGFKAGYGQVIWHSDGRITELASPSVTDWASADFSILVGASGSGAVTPQTAFVRSLSGVIATFPLANTHTRLLYGVPDGSAAYGYAATSDYFDYRPIRWTRENGFEVSDATTKKFADGTLLPYYGGFATSDGSLIFGPMPVFYQGGQEIGGGLGVWDKAHGLRSLQSVLATVHGLTLDGWTLVRVHGISADGNTVVGQGNYRASNNQPEVSRHWIIRNFLTVVPPPPKPPANFDRAAPKILFFPRKTKKNFAALTVKTPKGTAAIEYLLGAGKWRSVSASSGSAQVKILPLKIGKNSVNVRVLFNDSSRSKISKVMIVRRK